MFRFLSCALIGFACSAGAAEYTLDLSVGNDALTNFTSTVTGQGQPGTWKVIEDEISSKDFAPLSKQAFSTSKRNVLAQLSKDETDEHFPLLIFKNIVFEDFKITTRFKCVSGKVEQMAGIAFKIQDEKNYYIVRASSAGNTFKFYKFIDGQRTVPIGNDISIPAGTWHEMGIECKGDEIRCYLDGKEAIPMLTDSSFKAGRIGFWTKSDAVSYFADTHITYTPREPFAQRVVRDIMEENPRLIGVKIYAYKGKEIRLIASSDEKELGKLGTDIEENVINHEKVYFGKAKDVCAVTVPLRDRNGDSVGALYVAMKSFPGETQNNAVARTIPINQAISARIHSTDDFVQ